MDRANYETLEVLINETGVGLRIGFVETKNFDDHYSFNIVEWQFRYNLAKYHKRIIRWG